MMEMAGMDFAAKRHKKQKNNKEKELMKRPMSDVFCLSPTSFSNYSMRRMIASNASNDSGTCLYLFGWQSV